MCNVCQPHPSRPTEPPLCLILLLCVEGSAHGTARQSEGVWDGAVQLTDDLIYSFLPARVRVPPVVNSRIKLPQSHLGHLDELLRDLVGQRRQELTTFELTFLFDIFSL